MVPGGIPGGGQLPDPGSQPTPPGGVEDPQTIPAMPMPPVLPTLTGTYCHYYAKHTVDNKSAVTYVQRLREDMVDQTGMDEQVKAWCRSLGQAPGLWQVYRKCGIPISPTKAQIDAAPSLALDAWSN